MVGIVSGNGLGLFNASRNILGGFGSPQGGAQVNLSNGNLVIQGLDRSLSGLGLDLSALRTYNLQGTVGGTDGWFWEGERKVQLVGTLNTAGSSVIRTAADGHETVFAWNGTAYVSSEGDGAHDSLAWNAGSSQWVWTEGGSRVQERYNGTTGRLVSVTDASGNTQTFAYDGSNRLSSITDASGTQIVFNYDASGRLSRLDTRAVSGGPLTQQDYYTYDASGRLSSVSTDLTPADNSIVDGVVYTTTYTYEGTSLRVASITQGDGTAVGFTYVLVGSGYRVQTVTDAAGTTTFSYDTANRTTTITNGLGQAWQYVYDTSDRLAQVKTPAINGQVQITTYAYDADGNVTSVTDALNRAVTYQYDTNGNLTLERDALGNTVVRSYTATNQLQNETRYTSPSTWNGSSWTLPADSEALTHRYVYDGNSRLRFSVSAEGRVSEYTYTSAGLPEYEIHYTGAAYDVSGLAPTGTLSLSQLQTWTGVPTNVAVQTRSKREYDARGNLNKRIDYATVSGGSGVLDAAARVTNYVYSQYGQLLQTIAVTGSGRTTNTTQTSYVYDGAGRLTSETTAAGTRTYAYDSVAHTTTVTSAAGMTAVDTFDATGRLTSHVEAATGLASRSTGYFYDDAGRLTMVQDAAGARSYLFYDEAGRVVGRVDALGGVTETVYNAAGQITTDVRYATRVDTSSWFNGTSVVPASLAVIRPATTVGDRSTAFGYDGAGRRTTITDAANVASTTTYDGVGRVVRTQTGDRYTRFFYDKDGRLLAKLDAEGYLTQYAYDQAGQLRQTLRYAGQTTAGLRDAGTLPQLLASLPDTSGLSSWVFYDSAGRKVGEVSEQQYVTAYVYNEEARTQQAIVYTNLPYTGVITTATTLADITAWLAAQSGILTNTTTIQYDTQGRVQSRTTQDGTVTAYEYDASGRLVKETAAAGTLVARETDYRYDAYNQMISRLWGEGATHLAAGMTEAQVAAVHAQYGERYSYDVLGRRAQVTDRAGNVTSYYYDDNGRLTHVINALGEIAERGYNAFGDVTETRSYKQVLTGSMLTQAGITLTGGRLTTSLKALVEGIRDANNDIRLQRSYTTRGLLQEQVDGEGWRTQYTYNNFGEMETLARERSANVFTTTSYAYDKRGFRVSQTADVGGLNVLTSQGIDAFGRVISSKDALDKTTTTAYTNNGRTVTETDPLNHTRSRTYDALGRTLTVVDGLNNTSTYAWDDSLRSVSVTTPEGIVTRTVNNEHGQVFTVTDGNTHTTTYTYNRNGDLDTTTNELAVVVQDNAYDDAGRLLTSTDAAGAQIAYTYDALNRVLTRTEVATGNTTEYHYDTHGRQVTVIEAKNTAQQRVTEYIYDDNGAVLTATTDPSGLELCTTYTYDGLGNKLSVAQGTVASPAQQMTTFQYDALGRITGQSEVMAATSTTTTQYMLEASSAESTANLDATTAAASDVIAMSPSVSTYQNGSDVTVSSSVSGTQNYSQVVQLSDGNTLVAWTLDNGAGWRAQRYNSAGAAVGSEITLNTIAAGGAATRNYDVSVAALAGGGFVAVWTNRNSGGTDQGNIWMRRFDASGNALDATEVQVNTAATDYVNGSTTYTQGRAKVVALTGGGYAIAWLSPKSNVPRYEAHYRVYNSSGVAQCADSRADTGVGSSFSSERVTITAMAGGGYVITWAEIESSKNQVNYRGRTYTQTGASSTGIKDFVSGLTLTAGDLRLVALADGNLAAVWQSSPGDQTLSAEVFDNKLDPSSGVTSISLSGGVVFGNYTIAAAGGGYTLAYEAKPVDLSTTTLMLQGVAADNTLLGAATQLQALNGSHAFEASLAVCPDSSVMVGWSRTAAAGGAAVLFRKVTAVSASRVAGQSATARYQDASSTVRLADGSLLVAWPRTNNNGWAAQRYDASGSELGSEISLNTTGVGGASTVGNPNDVSLAALPGGGFVATWTNRDDIYMRRFDVAGVALDSADVLVNTTTTDYEPGGPVYATQCNARVAVLVDGSYVITWQSPITSGNQDNYRTYFQRFSSAGVKLGSETRVDALAGSSDSAESPQVLALQGGGFVISYAEVLGGAAPDYIKGVIYDASGVAQTAPLVLSTQTVEQNPGISRLVSRADGGFVLVWQKSLGFRSILAQGYSSLGVAIGSTTTLVNAGTGYNIDSFSVAASSAGYSLVYTTRNTTLSSLSLYLKSFSFNGADIGSASQLASDAISLNQSYAASISTTLDERVLVTWSAISPGSSETTINGQLLSVIPPILSATSASQKISQVVRLSDGGYLVAWDLYAGLGWKVQRYTSAGVKVGNEFVLNSLEAGGSLQRSVDVSLTGLPGGGFAAVWVNGNDIYLRRFDANGAALDAIEQQVNTTTTDYGAYIQNKPVITSFADGSFVVVWQSPVDSTPTYRTYMQRYSSAGVKVGGETQVDSTTGAISAESPRVLTLGNGNFVVAYRAVSGTGVVYTAKVFTASGVPVGNEQALASLGADAGDLQLTALSGGGFVAVWRASTGSDVLSARAFNADGTPVGASAATILAPGAADDLVSFSLTATSNDGYALAYQLRRADLSGTRACLQRYGAQHQALGDALEVASTTDGAMFLAPSVTTLGDGQLAVTWSGPAGAMGHRGVYTQLFAGIETPVTTYQAAAALTTEYRYDAAGRVTRTIDPLGNSSWQVYDAAGNVRYTVNALGEVAQYDRDANNRVIGTRAYAAVVATAGLGDVVTQSQLESLLIAGSGDVQGWAIHDLDGRMIFQVDALRHATEYRYDDAGNVLEVRSLTATLPADTNSWATYLATPRDGLATHRVYDGLNRLRFEIDPLGNVSEWRYDATGRVTDRLAYSTALPANTDYTETAVSTAMGSSSARRTHYVYNVAGQLRYEFALVSGAASGAITEHVYDTLGREVVTRSFAAPAGLTGFLEGDLDAARDAALSAPTAATDVRTTRQVYDAAGNLRYVINAQDQVLEQRFDALGRVVRTLQYRHAVTLIDPQPTLAQVDAAVQLANPVADVANNRHDTYVVRDSLGRERFVIDALGNIAEKTYDSFGNVTSQREYAPGIALNFGDYSELTVASVLASASLTASQVHTTRFAYDALGRLRYTLDAANYLSEQVYDHFGNIVARTRYGAGVTNPAVVNGGNALAETQLQAEALIQSQARTTRYVYDRAGRLHYSIDAMGFVTGQVRDGDGNVLRETHYETAVSLGGNPDEGAVATALGSQSGRSTHYRYDAEGRATYVIDALGFVTARTFDAFGNVGAETKFAAPLIGGVSDAETTGDLATRIGSLSTVGARTTTWHYNLLGQLDTQTGPMARFTLNLSGSPVAVDGQLVTRFAYDDFGNLMTRSEGEVTGNRVDNNAPVTDTGGVRITSYKYDELGRQIKTTAPGWYDVSEQKFFATAGGETDRFQVSTEVVYDGFGNAVLHQVTTWDATAAQIVTANTYRVYDAMNRLQFEIDARGYVTRNDYDGFGNIVAVTRYALELSSLPAPLTSATVQNAVDLVAGQSSRVLTMTYDALNRKTSVAQPQVNAYVYGGDAASAGSGLVAVVGGLDANAIQGYANVTGATTTGVPSVSWTYNAWGEQVKEDIAGGPTTFSYFDALGRKVAMVDGGGYYTAFTYFADTDKVATQTEYATALSLGGISENTLPPAPASAGTDRALAYTYDNLLRLTRIDRLNATWWLANAAQTSYSQQTGTLALSQNQYNAFGEAVQSTDAAGNVTTLQYDGLGRVTQVTEPVRRTAKDGGVDGIDPFWSVQASGVTLAENRLSASPVITLAYDQFGQAVEQVRAAASGQAGLLQSSKTVYDHAGNVVATEDASGAVIEYGVDAQGRTVRESQVLHQDFEQWAGVGLVTLNRQRTYAYDLLGRQTATIDHYVDEANIARTTTDSAVYNAFGEVEQKWLNDSMIESCVYDQAGRVVARTNGGGTTQYDYDLAGRVTRTRQTGAAGTSDDRITVTVYDALGRAIEQRLPHFSVNLASASDTSTTLTDAIPLIRQQYDRWGNVTQKTDARGYVWKYSYDADNRQLTAESPQTTAVTDTGASITISQLQTTRYDRLGNVAMELDGTIQGGVTTQLRNDKQFYNEVGQLTREIDALGAARNYAVDAHGNRVATLDALGTVRYSNFDAMNRVTETGILRNAASGYGVANPLYAAAPETLVTTVTAANSTFILPVSARLTNGGHVVAWTEGGGETFRAQRYNSAGEPVGGAIVLNATPGSGTASSSEPVAIAGLDGGGFVAVWERGNDIYMRRFGQDGVALDSQDVLVNDVTTDQGALFQCEPSVATLSDGSFVIAWSSPTSSSAYSVYATRYAADGTVLKTDTLVNTVATASRPTVQALANGTYAIVYANGPSVLMKKFTASDSAGSEITVNGFGLAGVCETRTITLASGNLLVAWAHGTAISVQELTQGGIKVGGEVTVAIADRATTFSESFGLAALGDGGYALSYEVRGSSESTTYVARYDSEHRLAAARLLADQHASTAHGTPSLLALAGDDLLLAWHSDADVANPGRVYTQRFTALNDAAYSDYTTATSSAFLATQPVLPADVAINTSVAGAVNYPQVTRLAGGGFIAAWTLDDGSGWRARRFDAAGNAVGAEIVLNTISGNGSAQRNLDVSIVELAGGGFVATWTNSDDVYARRFDANGVALDTVEQRVNTTTTDYGAYAQKNPTVAALSGGDYVVVWQSPVSATPEYQVFMQRYSGAGVPQGAETQVNTGIYQFANDPQIVALSGGGFAVSYMSGNDLGTTAYSSQGVALNAEKKAGALNGSIVALSTGGFVAVWQESGGGGTSSLHARYYWEDGTNNGGSFSLSGVGPTGAISSFDVIGTADGSFAVVSDLIPTGSSATESWLCYFGASGPVAAEQVATAVDAQSFASALVYLGDGKVGVVWERTANGQDGAGIRAATFDVEYEVDYASYRGAVQQSALQSFLYDEAGQRYAEFRGEAVVTGGGDAGNVRYSRFDERGNIVATRTAAGIVGLTGFDDDNRRTRQTDALGNYLEWTYDAYGRTATSRDLAGRVTTYTYNGFGQVLTETTADVADAAKVYNPSGMSGQSVTFYGGGAAPAADAAVVYDRANYTLNYTYYDNGMLSQLSTDYGLGGATDVFSTQRSYSADGHVVREISTRASSVTATVDDGTQDVRYRQDELGRLSGMVSASGAQTLFGSVTTPVASAAVDQFTYSYDEFGNRRRIYGNVYVPGAGTQIRDDWFKYDLADRVVVSGGLLSNGQIVIGKISGNAQGTLATYDAIGRRVTEETFVKYTWDDWGYYHDLYKVQTFFYDDLGNVVKNDELTRFRAPASTSADAPQSFGPRWFWDVPHVLRAAASESTVTRSLSAYDNYGRKISESEYNIKGEAVADHRYHYDGDSQMALQQDFASGTTNLLSQVLFADDGMRDAAGNQAAYRYEDFNNDGRTLEFDQAYQAMFVLYDDYKKGIDTISKNGALPGQVGFGKTTYDYAGRGELVQVASVGGTAFQRNFISNRFGQMIGRVDNVFTNARSAQGGYELRSQSHYYHEGSSLAEAGRLKSLQFSSQLDSLAGGDLPTTPSTHVASVGDTCTTIATAVYGDDAYAYLIADANGISDLDAQIAAGTALIIPSVISNSYNAYDTVKPYNQADVVGNTTPAPKLPPPPPPKKEKSKGVAQIVQIVVTAALVATGVPPYAAAMAGDYAAQATRQIANGQFDWDKALEGLLWGGFGAAMVAGVADDYDLEQTAIAGAAGYVGGQYSFGHHAFTQAATASVASNLTSQGLNIALGRQEEFSWSSLVTSAITAGISAELSEALTVTGHDAFNRYSPIRSWGDIGARAVASASVDMLSAHLADKWFGGPRPDYGMVAFQAAANAFGGYVTTRRQDMASDAVPVAEPEVLDEPMMASNPFARRPGLFDESDDFFAGMQETMRDFRDAMDSMPERQDTFIARSGQGISDLIGTSDPVAIEAFVRANRMSSATLLEGHQYVSPTAADFSASTGELGQAILDAHNTRPRQSIVDGEIDNSYVQSGIAMRADRAQREEQALRKYFDGQVSPWTERLPEDAAAILSGVLQGAAQPAFQVRDVAMSAFGYGYNEFTGDEYQFDSWSMAGRAGESGQGFGATWRAANENNPLGMLGLGAARMASADNALQMLEGASEAMMGAMGVVPGLGAMRPRKMGGWGVPDSELRGFTYNAIENPGPLASLPNTPAANFFGGRYNSTVLTEDLVLYRGGKVGEPLGQWFTREAPESLAQIRIDSAVKSQWIDPKTGILTGSSPIDNLYAIKIPKGTTIYEGPVGYQGGVHLGGLNTNQVFVQTPWKIPGVQEMWSRPIK